MALQFCKYSAEYKILNILMNWIWNANSKLSKDQGSFNVKDQNKKKKFNTAKLASKISSTSPSNICTRHLFPIIYVRKQERVLLRFRLRLILRFY